MRANLAELLPAARSEGRAVAGFNIFGLDEAYRVVAAAEARDRPVIIMTNKEIVRAIPVEVLGPALQSVADRARVPVCVHLDHTTDIDLLERAINAGYSSVMFDGSQQPYEDNLAGTRRAVELARGRGVSVEGEIGSVSYNEAGSTIRHELTDPGEAARFAEESGVDALAVSVGTIHKLVHTTAEVDMSLLQRIGERVATPLVIHGTSGIAEDDLRRMAAGLVAKFNIGTLLRRAWGETLRAEFQRRPDAFDRLTLTALSLDRLQEAAERMIAILAAPEAAHTYQQER